MHGPLITARHRLRSSLPAGRDAVAGLLAFTAIFPLALFDGGYFPTAWGVPALVGLWIAAIALTVAPAPLHGREAVALATLAALLGWSALSFLWTTDRAQTILELERLAIYVAALAALLLVARRESVSWLLGGAATAIVVTCLVGLAGRLFQDVFGRPEARIHDPAALYDPVGYSNALGDLSAIGVFLLAGFLTHARRPVARALAAAASVILLAALALSLSRGAWLAFGVGILVALCLAPRRTALLGRLVAVALPGAVVVALCLRSEALLTRRSSEASAVREGHRLALAIAALAVGAAILATVGPALASRLRATAPVGRAAFGIGLLAALLLATVAVWAGGTSPPTERGGSTARDSPRILPTERFFSVSAGRRDRFWQAAWDDFEAHPLVGSGSGTFGRYWLEHRPVGKFVRDAHSLYLETLAELGIVGLALLVAALAAPVASAVSVRDEALVPAALGAYSVYLVHAGVDWLWEMPVPTTAALVCGAALLVAGRPGVSKPLARPVRIAGVGAALALSGLAFVGLIGNSAIAASEQSLIAGDPQRAEAQARRATTWLPWAPEPWLLLARSQLARGEQAAARRSLDRALQLDPGNWLLWYERGLAATGPERRRYFVSAARLNPRDMRRLVGPAELAPTSTR